VNDVIVGVLLKCFALLISVLIVCYTRVFLRRFRDPIRVPRILKRVPRIKENYHRVPKIIKNRVPRIR